MKFSTGGIVYEGGVTKFDTDTAIDCGFGYTGDELANNTVVTKTPQYVQDLLLPNYYYTNTDVLAKMGYDKYLNYLIGNGSSTSKKTMPVLISVPNNYVLYDSSISTHFIKNLFILAYYNGLATSGKNNATVISSIFPALNGAYTLPFPPTQLRCLKFYDSTNTAISLTTMTAGDVVSASSGIKYCMYKSPTTGKEYPLKFYTRTDGVICDMYIGGYHMQLVTYNDASNEFTAGSAVYVSACNDSDFCNKFLFSLNNLPFTKTTAGLPADAQPHATSQYEYIFGKDSDNNTMAWSISSKDRVIGKNIVDNYIRYYKAFNDTGLVVGNGLALDFDPNIFNTVGIDYPSNYSTIGTLPTGFDFNRVGVDSFTNGRVSPLKYANDDNTGNSLYLPLGVYMLDPKGVDIAGTYPNAPSVNSSPSNLIVYSSNGNTLIQEISFNNTSFPTMFRINNQINSNTSFDNYWSSWSDYAWK